MAVEWMLVTGAVWGITNALMKKGSRGLNQQQQPRSLVQDWIQVLRAWDYILPFLMNLSASVIFFAKLSDSPISLAVPITNATTFASTAIAGSVLGEPVRPGQTLLGLLFIISGIVLCCSYE